MAGSEKPQVVAEVLSYLERTAPQQYPAELLLTAWPPPAQSRLLCARR